jgi:hypothetical protein
MPEHGGNTLEVLSGWLDMDRDEVERLQGAGVIK